MTPASPTVLDPDRSGVLSRAGNARLREFCPGSAVLALLESASSDLLCAAAPADALSRAAEPGLSFRDGVRGGRVVGSL